MKILLKKEQKKVCNAIVANTIMAFDLLDLDKIDAKRTIEYTEHLIENTMNAVLAVGGWNAMLEAKETICRYQKRIEAKHLKEYAMQAIPTVPKGPILEELRDAFSSITRPTKCQSPKLPAEGADCTELYDGVFNKIKEDNENRISSNESTDKGEERAGTFE